MSEHFTDRCRTVGFGILCVLALGLTAGCESAPTSEAQNTRPSVLPVPGSRTGDGSSKIALIAEFSGMPGDEGSVLCRWRIVNKDTGQSYFINFKYGQSTYQMAVDPGLYQTSRLGCGINRIWELDDVFKDGFRVDRGQISYLGKIYFEFNDGQLTRIRKASRTESEQAFKTTLDAVGPQDQKSFISGFTEKPLDMSMLDPSAKDDSFNVKVKGLPKGSTALQNLLKSLEGCSNQESLIDPIRFGRLSYTALYQDGRFSEMKQRDEANAFSDRLRSCVERDIMAFHPENRKSVEVEVKY